MSIHTEIRDQILIVRPSGNVSKPVAAELEELLSSAMDDGVNYMVFELSSLTQISSEGLRTILKTVKALRDAHGLVAVVGLRAQVRSVFEVGGFFALLDEFDKLEDALDAIHEEIGNH
jgi:anti-anti-sigma factor